MKKDMRVSYPLWQMISIIFLMAFVFLIGFSSEFKTFKDGGFEFIVEWNNIEKFVVSIVLLLFILFLALFNWNVVKHNRSMPMHKINLFTLKPQEYMEDDELFQELTKRATKKVYSYYTLAIPILAGIYVASPFGRTEMIIGFLLLAVGQYFIYYKNIKKYITEDE
ncbi:hypothetical protein [Sporosarcina limicola]|uniref:Protein-S-isoprenylcysteine O-methyltransferase Ste14 n=1 Tax=Sporosarcina limicola TaxID=34101 RepID=A0A927MNI5_9BACL|nr:hypothetical protein [Sporosarcina limicola]MBE1554456.1 protein-S-isoprenylcysteine O-methyltransferase Ste14 [Sporosarcina limicola]